MSTYLKQYICSAILMVLTFLPGWCQEGITVPWNQYAPTPKALEMTRYGHMPPDLNSGIYSCDIPIYTYEDKYFTIPVSLHYSSSGFQPARMSDEAGLHWTLMAGGAITREIVGWDDFELTYGLINSGAQVTDSTMYYIIRTNPSHPVYSYTSPINTPQLYGSSEECSSDRYHFSFPGHSGSFVMNHAGGGFLVYGTQRGRKVYTITYDGSTQSFTIKTGDGYSYRFGYDYLGGGTKAKEINWSRNATLNEDEDPVSLLQQNYHVVTWLLDRITAPDGSTVYFEYDAAWTENDIPVVNQDDVLTTFNRHPYKIPDENGTQFFKSASLTKTSYLRKIVIDKDLGQMDSLVVVFNWTMPSTRELSVGGNDSYKRLVVPRRRLSSVEIKKGNTVLRRADLTYSLNGTRPLLMNVSLSGIGNYSMEYWTDSSKPLPGILTNGLDFWGYYNGREDLEDSFFCPMEVDSVLNERIIQSGMDPSWQYAVLGQLKKITYPTGGFTYLEYESNHANKIVLRRNNYSAGIQPADPYLNEPESYTWDPYAYLPSLFPIDILGHSLGQDCGGVRVKTIWDSGGGDMSEYNYTYSDGIVQQFPRFYESKAANGDPIYNPALRYPGSSFDERHVAYGTVRQTNADSSYVVTTFSDWNHYPDVYSSFHEGYDGNQNATVEDSLLQNFYDNILREPDSRVYQRGLPISRKMYNKTGQLVSEESWEYNDEGSEFNAYALCSGRYAWTARTFLCDRLPSEYSRTEWLDQSGMSFEEVTDYEYNDRGQLASTTRVFGGHTEIQTTRYPADIAGGIYTSMAEANYLDKPVEQTIIRDGKVISASLTTYNSFSGKYLPIAFYRAEVGNGIPAIDYDPYFGQTVSSIYTQETSIINYDNHGNVLLSEDRDGIPTTYIWDSQGDKLKAIFVGSINGEHTYYVRSAVPHSETANYFNADPVQKTFTSEMSGQCNFSFTPQDTTVFIEAMLDGNAVSLQRLGNGARGPSSPINITAGAHTLTITCVGNGLILRGGLVPIDTYPLSGSLSLTYPVQGVSSQGGIGTDCLFEDFESGAGTAGYGFQSDKGRTSSYNLSVLMVPNHPYILDYMRKENGKWQYVREIVTPTTRPYTKSIAASTSSPIDHIRFYPADNAVSSFTWHPTGELRCKVDGSGRVEIYEYDNLGRLTAIRDGDEALLKDYTYHYKH